MYVVRAFLRLSLALLFFLQCVDVVLLSFAVDHLPSLLLALPVSYECFFSFGWILLFVILLFTFLLFSFVAVPFPHVLLV